MAWRFPTVNTEEGVRELNRYLQDRSYIEGYHPTQDDVEVHKAVGSAPDAKKFGHVVRWFKHINSFSAEAQAAFPAGAAKPAPKEEKPAAGGDEDVDFFAEETPEEAAAREADEEAKRQAAAASKKISNQKSSVVIDIKPWDDETDLKEMERCVRTIEMEGLLWGASKQVEVGYGIKKVQIMMTIVDDLVSTEELEEQILGFDDLVQSMDIVAFNKL
jgi:elongation factor 1-beta